MHVNEATKFLNQSHTSGTGLLAVIFAVLALSYHAGAYAQSQNEVPPLWTTAVEGNVLYEKFCQQCHGPKGRAPESVRELFPNIFPDLKKSKKLCVAPGRPGLEASSQAGSPAARLRRKSETYLRYMHWERNMPYRTYLSPEQTARLLTFLGSWCEAPQDESREESSAALPGSAESPMKDKPGKDEPEQNKSGQNKSSPPDEED